MEITINLLLLQVGQQTSFSLVTNKKAEVMERFALILFDKTRQSKSQLNLVHIVDRNGLVKLQETITLERICLVLETRLWLLIVRHVHENLFNPFFQGVEVI